MCSTFWQRDMLGGQHSCLVRLIGCAPCLFAFGTTITKYKEKITSSVPGESHTTHSLHRTSACSRTVWVAFSCLSGGYP
jgi:hypothetical protein